MADAGASMYTFHYEATNEPARCIRKVQEAGMKVIHVYAVTVFIKFCTFLQNLLSR